MKINVKPLFAIALLIILLFSFSGSALAVREDVCMPNACSHSGKRILSTNIFYSPTPQYCIVYARVKYKCTSCGYTWTADEYVDAISHQRTTADRGHATGNKHRYRYECKNCHYILSGDYTYTCYGPPCVLPNIITALPR